MAAPPRMELCNDVPAPPCEYQPFRENTAIHSEVRCLDRGGREVRISAMGDSEQGPVLSPQTNQSESRSWAPMAAGGAFVLLLVVVVILLTRGGKSTGNPADPNLAKLQVSNLHMATAQNFAPWPCASWKPEAWPDSD